MNKVTAFLFIHQHLLALLLGILPWVVTDAATYPSTPILPPSFSSSCCTAELANLFSALLLLPWGIPLAKVPLLLHSKGRGRGKRNLANAAQRLCGKTEKAKRGLSLCRGVSFGRTFGCKICQQMVA